MASPTNDFHLADSISLDDLSITFHVAERVPDHRDVMVQKVFNLPDTQAVQIAVKDGNTNSIAAYVVAKDMTAVSIHIRSEARHKLVIRAGGVNVAVPTNTSNLDISTRPSQDYFVSPAQSRVDGFTIKPGQGQVRQFVLKSPGSGYVPFSVHPTPCLPWYLKYI